MVRLRTSAAIADSLSEAPRAGRRRMSIEAALNWAYQIELPNLRAGDDLDGLQSSLGKLGAPRVDGGRIDYDSDAVARIVAPDALAIGKAVARLREHELEPPIDGGDTSRRAFIAYRGRAETLVVVHAKLGTRPEIGQPPECGPRLAGNGRPMVVRLAGRTERLITGEETSFAAEELVLAPPPRSRGAGQWPTGSACPLLWWPTFESVARERAEWEIWAAALAWLPPLLVNLERIEIVPSDLRAEGSRRA